MRSARLTFRSGTAHLFNGTELVSRGLVEALLQALTRDGVDWTARFKILELLSLFANKSPLARHRLAHSNLQPLALIVATADADHARAAMLAGERE
jgi:hypothetical protein